VAKGLHPAPGVLRCAGLAEVACRQQQQTRHSTLSTTCNTQLPGTCACCCSVQPEQLPLWHPACLFVPKQTPAAAAAATALTCCPHVQHSLCAGTATHHRSVDALTCRHASAHSTGQRLGCHTPGTIIRRRQQMLLAATQGTHNACMRLTQSPSACCCTCSHPTHAPVRGSMCPAASPMISRWSSCVALRP
jgi:hypothetical protein